MTEEQTQQYSTEMQPLNVPDGIPEGLWVSISTYLSDGDWMPPQGSPGLRAMVKIGGKAMPSDFEWIEKQEALQWEAKRLIAEVHRIAPMPTPGLLITEGDSSIEYPDWIGQTWMQTLMLPWSQDLDAAIITGGLYVESATSA